MWVITVYENKNKNIKIFEYDQEEEAREAYNNIHEFKIITEIVYFDHSLL